MMTSFVSSSFIFPFIIFTAIFPFTTPMPDSANHCTENFTCGSFKNLTYPFGKDGLGCGDPDFQLVDCDSNDGPYMYFKDGGRFRLKNPTVLDRDKGVVQLEILLNSTQPDCSTHLRQLLSSESLPYGSNFSSDIDNAYESSDESKFLVCDVNSHGSLGSACGFYFFSPDYNYIPTCNPKIITFPTNTAYTRPIFDYLLRETGLLLEATVPLDRMTACANCIVANSTNSCGINEKYEFRCFCGDKPCPGKHNNKHSTPAIIGGAVAGACVLLLGLGGIFLRRRSLRKRRDTSGVNSLIAPGTSFPNNKDEEYGKISVGSVPIFSYEELRDATSSFSDRNELGEGGFGTVYHGRLKDGREVAVKKLYQHHHTRRVDQFLKEANVYTNLLHPNVVRLYGCTRPNSEELLLVFEYVPNGTLADHLHGSRRGDHGGLSLSTRLKIALQTAEALFFLHNNDPPVFHRDVKSLNILLDEHMDAKVADFGLCRPVPVNATHVTTAPQGTPGYVDPEYHQCYQLTEKSDVYSFGVVLVEIISGKMAVDINRDRKDINLASMAVSKIQGGTLDELLDPALQSVMKKDEGARDAVTCLAELAFRCLASQREDRPAMKEVVEVLQDLRGQTDDRKDRKRNGVAPPSPISVHDKWPSTTTTPSNNSADCLAHGV